jgi:transcriptional regulator GlxA family with amidase domain
MKIFRTFQMFFALFLLASSSTVFAHEMSSNNLRVAVLLFDGVEEIDYAGPIEAFGASGPKVFTVGQTKSTVESVWGLKVTPDYDFSDAPEADVLVVPGGGIKEAWKNPKLLDWIRERSAKVQVVLAVCSGAFILGKAGLLDGIQATTTASLRPQLAKMFPSTSVSEKRYVDAGKIITTAGLSAGIDGTLYLIARQGGKKKAEAVATYMEYDWKPSTN